MPKLFLPTENSTKEKIQSDVEFLKKSKLLHELLVAITAPVVIFNENGEIIYANEMMETVSQYKSDALIGMRIGDSLDCIHSKLISEGCGTADFCKGCDITKVISSSLEGKKGKEECQVTRVVDSTQDNLELEVTATPFEYYERIYTVFVIRDIQNQKRKRELERIFFHDILNTTGNLKNLIDVIKTQGKENIDTELFEMLEETSQHVISEIQQQRELLAAENNDLTVNYTLINSFDVVNYIYHQYIHYKTENKVQLKIASKAGNIVFKTDPVLCERVLGNLTKNALEASS
ncbi:MAG: nitrogen fixation/metabolism regulation signal transduction histidine kinase, partial [bacterium]